HAARALLLELSLRVRKIDLSPVLEPLGHRTGRLFLPVNFDEPGRFTHNSLGVSFEKNSPDLVISCFLTQCQRARQTRARGSRPSPSPRPGARACSRAA